MGEPLFSDCAKSGKSYSGAMPVKIYEYKTCDTCRKALKYLEAKKVAFVKIPIVETPPTENEIKKMLKYIEARGGSFKNLFNTSGQVYRELKVGEKIKSGMSEEAAIKLLAENGKLIKRPFVLTDKDG